MLLQALARTILGALGKAGSVERILDEDKGLAAEKKVLISSPGPFWIDLRAEAFELLSQAERNPAVHENVYALLRWIDQLLEEHHGGELPTSGTLITDNEITTALWNAVIARPLSPYAVARLYRVALFLKDSGVIQLPDWWEEMLAASGFNPERYYIP